MSIANKVVAVAAMLIVFGAGFALAQQPATPAAPDIQKLVGKWSGWGTPPSGKAFSMQVEIKPDGTYASMIGSTSGQGVIKAAGGKLAAEGQLVGPGLAAGTGKSELSVATKGGKQVITGQGRNDAGPFNYELTKE